MKKYNYIIIGIITCTIIGNLISCNRYVPPVEKIVYVPVKDTISEKENIARIIELEHKNSILKDSLNYIKDSIGEDLFVARYKLGRIKYYTNIVNKKPSQLKYYKGWINRVLKE